MTEESNLPILGGIRVSIIEDCSSCAPRAIVGIDEMHNSKFGDWTSRVGRPAKIQRAPRGSLAVEIVQFAVFLFNIVEE